ncbi:helix-turn-helix transcriptional regulator [Bradyrhizobium sediminis]|uniref:Helix-turn-helix transcriptional regulator n=1 Tax=Bradyrhizobium sediminis TaxID=2840469 RepID=A0A975NF62_9BRAD|nr:helix-turn-helix transcriptional regulator [Bradyrhizobium sediminis]QWG13705.1 helix-turn-helix transcriptional regulator [Bradyrhizobium sediminis]
MGSSPEDYGGTKYPMIRTAVRQRALAEFLRKHRESIVKPVDDKHVGERRRRTVGLRREEVAEMAAISSTWYTRLEQGKEVAPSSAALGRIADVLQLAPAERAYLFELGRRVDPNDASNFADDLVGKTIESCVRSISYPAFVLDRYWTMLFWNDELAELFPPWLNDPERNLLRLMFLNLNARTLVVDWEPRARSLLAQFRVDFGKYIDDQKMLDLVSKLSEESDHFRRLWQEQRVLSSDGIEKSYNHPQWGLLKFRQTTFLAASDSSIKLVILKPCNEAAITCLGR